MEDIKDKYYKLVCSTPKLKISEYDYLLKFKSIDAKNIFIESFLWYIYKDCLILYELKKDEFNAYYDFEDLFSDGVLLASKLYDYFTPAEDYHRSFVTFINFYRLKLLEIMHKSYAIKVSSSTYQRIKEVIKTRHDFYNENGYSINNDLLSKRTGYGKNIIKKSLEFVNTDNEELIDYFFTDDLIEQVDNDLLHEKIMELLSKMPDKWQEIVMRYYGLEDRKSESLEAISHDLGVTKACVHKIKKRALEKLFNNFGEYR